ncbi:hypothetical protein VP1G_06908 [Cytospora mali]|uniref:Rhodopsin domain-containing protein n=1 Tax=Cytospora mali TaxID=578113 RepID=A0A194V704_CYTMA|nr:hypothetical protein VP1G_06908 [Valsa mali var. pyri (nom. inval.)]
MESLLPPGVDPSKVPSSAPPPGVTPNFINPPSLSWAGRVAVYTALPLMVVFLALRLYVRIRSRLIGADDCLCLVAAASISAFCGQSLSLFLNDVFGRHAWDVSMSEHTEFYEKNVVISVCLYDIAVLFTKVSLLAFYLRIFQPSRRARILIWLGIVFISVFYVSCLVTNIILCFPRSNEKDSWILAGVQPRCGQPTLRLNVTQGIVNALTDFYALAVPLVLVLNLQLSPARKAGVFGIFLTGLFVAELNVGLICSCMPVVFVLFRGFAAKTGSMWASVRRWMGTRTRQTRSSSNGSFPLDGKYVPPEELPQVPKRALTGLLSFIRGSISHSQSGKSKVQTQQESHVELRPVDYNYHAYLNANYPGVARDKPVDVRASYV